MKTNNFILDNWEATVAAHASSEIGQKRECMTLLQKVILDSQQWRCDNSCSISAHFVFSIFCDLIWKDKRLIQQLAQAHIQFPRRQNHRNVHRVWHDAVVLIFEMYQCPLWCHKHNFYCFNTHFLFTSFVRVFFTVCVVSCRHCYILLLIQDECETIFWNVES